MASSFAVKIVLQGGMAGIKADLDAQLRRIKLNPLSIKIKVDTNSVDNAVKSNNKLTNSTKQAKAEVSNYEKVLNRTINSYRKQAISAEEYIKKLNNAIQTQKFKTLSDEKQIRVLNSLAQAESKLSTIQSTRRKVTALQALENQKIASNIGNLVGGGITSGGTALENIRRVESQQLSSISRVRQASINSENIRFNNVRKNQRLIEIENQRIASNMGNLVGGGITSRGSQLEEIKKIESQQISSINRVRQARIASENKAFDNARRRQKEINIENQRMASNIGNLIGGGISSRGSLLQSTMTPSIKPMDIERTLNNLKNLQIRMDQMAGGSASRFLNPAEIQAVNSRISALSQNFMNLSRPEVANSMRSIRTEMTRLNGIAQNTSRSTMDLGESLKQAAIKFP